MADNVSLNNASKNALSNNNNVSSSTNLVSSIFQRINESDLDFAKALSLRPIFTAPSKMTGEMPSLKPKEKELLQEMFSKWPLCGGPSLIDLFGFAIYQTWEDLMNLAFLDPANIPNQKAHYQSIRDTFDSRFVVCYQTILHNTQPHLPNSSQRFFLQPEKFADELSTFILAPLLEKRFEVIANTPAGQAKAKALDLKWKRVKERAQKVHELIALFQKFLRSSQVLLNVIESFPQHVPTNPVKSLEVMKTFCPYVDHYFKVGDTKASVTGFYEPIFSEIPAKIEAFLKSPKPATWLPIDKWFFDQMQSIGNALNNNFYYLNKDKANESYTYQQYCLENKISYSKEHSREDFLSSLSSRVLARHTEGMYISDAYTSFLKVVDSKQNRADFPCFHLYFTRLCFNFSIIRQMGLPYIETGVTSNEPELPIEKLYSPIRDDITANCIRMILHLPSKHMALMQQAHDALAQGTRALPLGISAFSLLKEKNDFLPPIIDILPSVLTGITSLHQKLVKMLKEGKESGVLKAEDRETIRQMLIDDALFLASFVMLIQDAQWLYVSRPDAHSIDSLPEELVDFLLLEEFEEIFKEPEPKIVEVQLAIITPEKIELEPTPQKQEEKVTKVYKQKAQKQKKVQAPPQVVPAPSPKAELEAPSKQEILKTTKLRKLNKILKKYGYDESESGVGSHTKIFNEGAGDMIVQPRRLKKGLLRRFYGQLHGAWESSQKKD